MVVLGGGTVARGASVVLVMFCLNQSSCILVSTFLCVFYYLVIYLEFFKSVMGL